MSERDWRFELTAYIDGELSESERAMLEAELLRDPRLRALEQKLRQTVTLMKSFPQAAPSADLKRGVLSQLESARSPRRNFWPLVIPVALTAAASALMLIRVRGDEVVDEDQVSIAQQMELVEDLDLVGLSTTFDIEVVEQLRDLEDQP